MKFIIDAQLPYTLSKFLIYKGFDSIHTLDFPNSNRTQDDEIRDFVLKEDRVLITKDSDFEDSFWLNGVPPKLILVTTGNISNKSLIEIFNKNITFIVEAISENTFIEIDQENVIIHA